MLRLLPDQLRYCLVPRLHSQSDDGEAQHLQGHMQRLVLQIPVCGICQTLDVCLGTSDMSDASAALCRLEATSSKSLAVLVWTAWEDAGSHNQGAWGRMQLVYTEKTDGMGSRPHSDFDIAELQGVAPVRVLSLGNEIMLGAGC